MVVYSPPVTPPALAIRCPKCNSPSSFVFAAYKQVPNKDLAYFKSSKNFTVIEGFFGHSGYYNIALYYHGVGNSLENIQDLPVGYNIDMWRQEYWFASTAEGYENSGSYRCSKCAVQKKYELSWPEDAYFQIEYKGKLLWAYDRETALKLLSYIESTTRKKRLVGYSGKPWNTFVTQDKFLRHIPEHFQTAKARPEIVKKLKSILDM